MNSVFPKPIQELPEAELPFKGARAFLSQGEDHQILFMEFSEELELPEHSHKSQWGVVMEGRIDLVIDGVAESFTKGDRYFIPEGVKHSGRIYEGYADMTYFGQKDRYKIK